MAGVISRESYFETGLDVLSDLGYGGLKLAEVCHRLGVTTGSFYHYFANWSAYTRDLVAYWVQVRTVGIIEEVSAEPDPRVRVGRLINEGLALPHGAEAAIRVWSAIDPDVNEVQAAVDLQRFDVLRESALEILKNEHQARVFAAWGLYVLVGYEQALVPRNAGDLAWIAVQLLDALDEGRFGTVPEPD
ncbi:MULTISPECIES: TetR/AcrR family transcriptional regulator [unclassified Mycobacterium]|uniref:TetR/AcrR family transcriptional regulator n=1 Tax=unclassified Mycobacterium TaxID=2642494 RepID=UPI0029C6E619|nr:MULTISPECIES: TetR/AcrR family transcriptional regulator [unclassified Mycobacterium]